MELIADVLLLAATVGAAVYCYVLAVRLRRFTTLETGMGGAIAVLSAQVDDMTKALQNAQSVASGSEQRLQDLTAKADMLSRRLELMVASLHDIPDPSVTGGPTGVPVPKHDAAEGEEEEPRRLRFVRRRAGVRALPEDEE